MGAFKRDSAGISRKLKDADTARAVRSVATAVANDARGRTDLPIEVTTWVTDRAVASVMIAHPAGAATQAKHGVLTRAAMAAGLKVRSR